MLPTSTRVVQEVCEPQEFNPPCFAAGWVTPGNWASIREFFFHEYGRCVGMVPRSSLKGKNNQMVEKRNEDPKTNQTKHPSPQAETPPSCSLSSALGETCSGCNHRPSVCEDLSSNPWKRPFLQHNPFNLWRIQDQSHAARQDSNLAAIPSERSLQLRVNRAQLPRGEADPTPFGTQRCQ